MLYSKVFYDKSSALVFLEKALLVGSYSEVCFRGLQCYRKKFFLNQWDLGSYRKENLRSRNVWSLNGYLMEREIDPEDVIRFSQLKM